MANKTFIGEEIFEFKPMRGLEIKYNTPGSGDFPIDPSPGDFPTPKDPPPAGGGSKGGPEEPPEQPEEDETPEKSNTLTFLAIGLIAFFLLRKK